MASAVRVLLAGVWESSVEALPATLRVVTFGAIVSGSVSSLGGAAGWKSGSGSSDKYRGPGSSSVRVLGSGRYV